jgi:acyl-CoA dehydrogenase
MQTTVDLRAASRDVRPVSTDLRLDVRAFLTEWGGSGSCDSWLRAFDPEFSLMLAERGWVGMTVPEAWGGGGRSFVERYVVTEELLRFGAPVAYHWFADRQIAPTLLASGNERLQSEILPAICRGELCVCIGISEPGAGSDVAAIATEAWREGERWLIDGQKVWTTGAMHAQFCHVVARSGRDAADRHSGLSEFVVPMDAPGITVRPITDLGGEAHFAEIFFDGVAVEEWRLLGTAGDAFRQLARQLDYERSGAERFLSTLPLLDALLSGLRANGAAAERWAVEIGELSSRLAALRAMAMSVAASMDAGAPPAATAALVKDLGARFERDVVALAIDAAEDVAAGIDGQPLLERFEARLREAQIAQPTFTLRGGTAEILRGIVARRALGLGRSS